MVKSSGISGFRFANVSFASVLVMLIWIKPDRYSVSDKRNWSGLLGKLKLSILLLPEGCMSMYGLVMGRTSITSVLVSLIIFSYERYLAGIRASEPFVAG